MLTSAGLWVEDGIRPFLESFQPGSATDDCGPRWRVLPAEVWALQSCLCG